MATRCRLCNHTGDCQDFDFTPDNTQLAIMVKAQFAPPKYPPVHPVDICTNTMCDNDALIGRFYCSEACELSHIGRGNLSHNPGNASLFDISDFDDDEEEDKYDVVARMRKEETAEIESLFQEVKLHDCPGRSMPCEECSRTKDVIHVNSLYLCADCMSNLPKLIKYYLNQRMNHMNPKE